MLRRVHAVAESVLPARVAERLPPGAPPAPWHPRRRAGGGGPRATGGAAAALARVLRCARRLPVTFSGFVDYAETPVGPYREVLASPVLLVGRRPPAAATV